MRLWLTIIAYNLGNLCRRLVLPQRIGNWSLTSLQQRLVNGGATCPLLLVAAGREPSDETVVCQHGAADGGSYESSRVKPPVVAMKKSIPEKTSQERVFENSDSGSDDNGFR